MRSKDDVARRFLALRGLVSSMANPDAGRAWVAEHGIAAWFSPREKAFFDASSPSEHDKIQMSWRAEAMVGVAWALGVHDQLEPLDQPMRTFGQLPLVQLSQRDPAGFFEAAELRPAAEIEAAENLLYEAHWAVRDAQLHGRPPPAGLHPGIVIERRYALSWIAGHGDSWDDVPLDT